MGYIPPHQKNRKSDSSEFSNRVPMGALYDEFMRRRRLRGAAQSTYDALLWELREQGIAQLEKPECRRRLSELSTKQLRDLIAALVRLRAKWPKITDELIGVLGDQL
jgi:hypothetical protein